MLAQKQLKSTPFCFDFVYLHQHFARPRPSKVYGLISNWGIVRRGLSPFFNLSKMQVLKLNNIKDNFKQFTLQYNEFQGCFHYDYERDFWHPHMDLIHVQSNSMEKQIDLFTNLIMNYNNFEVFNFKEKPFIMTFADVERALRVFLYEKNEILFTSPKVPESSGIYLFYDEFQNLVYLGKSSNLHKRIKVSLIGKDVYYFRFALTNSDADAVIYEQYYMSKIPQPKYNAAYPHEDSLLSLPELCFTNIKRITEYK